MKDNVEGINSGDATDILIVLPVISGDGPAVGQISSSDFQIQFRRSGRVVSVAKKVGKAVIKKGRSVSRKFSVTSKVTKQPRKNSSEINADHAAKQWIAHEKSFKERERMNSVFNQKLSFDGDGDYGDEGDDVVDEGDISTLASTVGISNEDDGDGDELGLAAADNIDLGKEHNEMPYKEAAEIAKIALEGINEDNNVFTEETVPSASASPRSENLRKRAESASVSPGEEISLTTPATGHAPTSGNPSTSASTKTASPSRPRIGSRVNFSPIAPSLGGIRKSISRKFGFSASDGSKKMSSNSNRDEQDGNYSDVDEGINSESLSPSSSSSSSPSSRISRPISHDKAEDNVVHVFVNKRYVKELEMTVQSNGFCLFTSNNQNKPDQDVLNFLRDKKIIHPGRNVVKFENTYTSRGRKNRKRYIEAFLYVWDSTDLVVISDIDGTITKSDVIGLLSNAVEQYDGHTHKGICKFYSDLGSMNLRFVYLTSRPISLMGYTRKFLVSVTQQEHHLPRGLTLCHPGSVKDVLYTELVAHNPDIFKADTITKQIVLPFAAAGRARDSKLFVAGFGNKLTDMRAYTECGMDIDDVYIIDKSSRVLCESDRSLIALEALGSNGGIAGTAKKKKIYNSLPRTVREKVNLDEEPDSVSGRNSIDGMNGNKVSRAKSFSFAALGRSVSRDSGSGASPQNSIGNGGLLGDGDGVQSSLRGGATAADLKVEIDAVGHEIITKMEIGTTSGGRMRMRRNSYHRVRTVSEAGNVGIEISSPTAAIKERRGSFASVDDGSEKDDDLDGEDGLNDFDFGDSPIGKRQRDVALNSYSDGRLLTKITAVVNELRNMAKQIEEAEI